METPLLQTKLYIPPVRPNLVPRLRLIKRLNAGLHRKLTLVSAPAGYGKTTLVSEWLRGTDRPCAWLSLDESDNDPARFLTYLVAALQTIDAQQQTAAQPPPGRVSITTLINDIAATARPFVLVLDDYHAIVEPDIHEMTSFLLEYQPPQMHLVITTRRDPPLALSRLRARGHATEIRADDLRFTDGEAEAFLRQTMALKLTADETATLTARTEGWVAGLQLAAVSIQGQTDRAAFVQTFAGSEQYVLDYLGEQVLQRQPEHIQSFLLRTAILDRLAGPLCDAVLDVGEATSQETLEHLERSNLFTIPLDRERRWYRYHCLFGDLLRQRLQKTCPQQTPELHRRAATWYERNGPVERAVAHWLAAQEFANAAQLVERFSWQKRVHGELNTLLGWLAALPGDVVRARPRLGISYAEILIHVGKPDAASAYLQDAEQVLAAGMDVVSQPERDDLLGQASAFRAITALHRGETSRAMTLAQQALALLPPGDSYARGLVQYVSGSVHLANGQLDQARQALHQAVATAHAVGHAYLAIGAMCARARVHSAQGHLGEAIATYQQTIMAAAGRGFGHKPVMGIVHARLGEALYALDDLDGAAKHIEKGRQLAEQGGISATAYQAYRVQAQVRQARGDGNGALAAVRRVIETAHQLGAPHFLHHARAFEALIHLRLGQLQAAARWARSYPRAPRDLGGPERRFVTLTLARVRLAQGDPASALALLRDLRRGVGAEELGERLVETLVLEALAQDALDKTRDALETLKRALSLAEAEGYARVFLDEGQTMVTLLQRAVPVASVSPYAGKLLSAFPPFVRQTPTRLLNPLTPRELEVLHLVAQGASNRTIAETLIVTTGTVKTHVSRIMGKLDVRNRTEAVARARELGILSTS